MRLGGGYGAHVGNGLTLLVMAELLLDPAIRLWVILPIVLITLMFGLVRHYVTVLLRSDKKTDVAQIKDGYVREYCALMDVIVDMVSLVDKRARTVLMCLYVIRFDREDLLVSNLFSVHLNTGEL